MSCMSENMDLGTSTTLLRNGPGTVFGWSPDGRWIAFPDSKGRLAIINVATVLA